MAAGLDHFVLAVHDLEAAAAFYQRLGFTVGARNRHPWGTHNRIVQCPGTFLELITVGEPEKLVEHAPGRFSFGACVRDFLAAGEGFAMLVLESRDAAADNDRFGADGIGGYEPFFFERQAVGPDGMTVRVAFSLAFARNEAMARQAFFVCQQHEPQSFWNPAFQQHPNGAVSFPAVTMVTADPAGQMAFLGRFAGAGDLEDDARSLILERGRINVLAPEAAQAHHGSDRAGLAAFTVTISDLRSLALRLDEAGIGYQLDALRLLVPSDAAYGVTIEFQAA
ncbi:MAG: VOC family protein [Bosea sp.]|nr:VOC family protein [Bosea sp. (in: a-proteobacteria)]